MRPSDGGRPLRLKSDIWVAGLLRRVFADGGFATVLRRGAADAGAIFIQAMHRDGTLSLYGPAPQTAAVDPPSADRSFELRLEAASAEAVAALMAGEQRFDTDLWLIEIETDRPEAYVDVTPA